MSVSREVNPLRVQVAFQGGGAKLVCLLAVAEALQDAETAGVIEIDRLAGTSAGSIVAALLAANRPISELARLLKERGKSQLSELFPERKWFLHLANLAINRPLYDERHLKAWLEKLFDGETHFGDLKRDLFVVATRLVGSEKRALYSTTNEEHAKRYLADVLASSCALPVVFRTGVQGDSQIDGGLCENLPVDDLLADPSRGEVLAVSFESERTDTPSRLLDFLKSFVTVMIDSNVDRSLRNLKPLNVHKISTSIGTFDFEKGFDALESAEYELIKNRAGAWIRELVESHAATNTDVPDAARPLVLDDVWRQGDPLTHLLMREVDRVYRQQHGEDDLSIDNSTLIVSAFSLLATDAEGSGKPDEIRQWVKLRPGQRDLYCYRLRLTADSDDPGGTFLQQAALTVSDPDGERLDVVILPVVDSTDRESRAPDPRTREVIVYFKPVIPKEDRDRSPYTIRQLRKIQDAMGDLREKGKDHLRNRNTRRTPVQRAEFVLFAPKAIAGAIQAKASDEIPIHSMSPKELDEFRNWAPLNFEAIGWYCEAVPPGEYCGVSLSLVRA